MATAPDGVRPPTLGVMTGRHASADSGRPGDGLVRAGAVLFAVGVLALVVSVVPAVISGDPAQPVLVVLAGTLLPLGFAVALVGLLRGARTARREARREPS